MYVPQLTRFFLRVQHDARIGTTHISLYMALFEIWNKNHFKNPIEISRGYLMPYAKISGVATYHRCMKDLNELGYIIYTPSFDPKVPSTVIIME